MSSNEWGIVTMPAAADPEGMAIKAREEAENQAKGWALKCERAKAEKKKLAKRVKELEHRPVEVATKDAAPEQIAAAEQRGRADAQSRIDNLTAQLEQERRKAAQVKPMAEEAGRALVEINVLFGQIQTASARIRVQLDQLDDVTRARVEAALDQALKWKKG